MACSFVVYIDESGDEGFVFNPGTSQGSSEWFVLSAIITRRESDLETVKLIDSVRSILGRKDQNPLHFRHLKHEHRLPLVTAISQAQLWSVSVLIHKPSIRDVFNFKAKYRLYFYATRHLLERVSWLCHDQRREGEGDGSAEVIFSNRGGMSYDDLREYFNLLRLQAQTNGIRIDWSVIDSTQIMAYPPDKRMGLQIADAVASSFYFAVQPTPYGFTEDRYVHILKPIVYQHQKNHLNYGVKYWPTEASDFIETTDMYAGLRTIFPK